MTGVTGQAAARWPCPCCGYQVFTEPPGSYETCPVCGWEDDLSQLRFATTGGGANDLSLAGAQRAFARRERQGANDLGRPPEDPGYTRDPGRHPLAPGSGRVEVPEPGQDHGRSYARDPAAYYYWQRPGGEHPAT
jgi:cysteine-rich CPCC protein